MIELRQETTWPTVIANEARLDAAIVAVYLMLFGMLVHAGAWVLWTVLRERIGRLSAPIPE